MTRTRLAAIALSLALTTGLAAGCGSDEEETASSGAAATSSDQPAGGSATSAPDGKQLFGANCSACHTLADANASGTTGPNLDDLKPSADTVAKQVKGGGGAMPAFGDQLSPEEIGAIADYVSGNAGS